MNRRNIRQTLILMRDTLGRFVRMRMPPPAMPPPAMPRPTRTRRTVTRPADVQLALF